MENTAGRWQRAADSRKEFRIAKAAIADCTRPPRLARPPRLKPRDAGRARMAGGDCEIFQFLVVSIYNLKSKMTS